MNLSIQAVIFKKFVYYKQGIQAKSSGPFIQATSEFEFTNIQAKSSGPTSEFEFTNIQAKSSGPTSEFEFTNIQAKSSGRSSMSIH